MPQIRQYPEVTTTLSTDGLLLDRLGQGSIWTVLPDLLSWLQPTTSYANDAAAAVGGVAIGQLYRNGSVVQIRIT